MGRHAEGWKLSWRDGIAHVRFRHQGHRYDFSTGERTEGPARAKAAEIYANVIAGINLKPNVAWSHDVNGYGPNFSEGAKAVSVGVDADYQNTYTASISYTDFFGGDYNPVNDRDFVAVSFGVNF